MTVGFGAVTFRGRPQGEGRQACNLELPGRPASASPSAAAQGVSCSLRAWLEGKSHPGSWQSLASCSHPRSDQRKARPSQLGWVPRGPGGRTGQGASPAPHAPSQDLRAGHPHGLPSSCGASGSSAPCALDHRPRCLAIGQAAHILASDPSWRQSSPSSRQRWRVASRRPFSQCGAAGKASLPPPQHHCLPRGLQPPLAGLSRPNPAVSGRVTARVPPQ